MDYISTARKHAEFPRMIFYGRTDTASLLRYDE